MQLSVIILNYNVRYFLELCILSVQRATENLDAEIIVVDNNSHDNSCAMVVSRFPSVRLIENKENTGFPKGNNIGVAAAKGEYICILNPDTVVAEDTFIKVLEFAQSKTDLGIVGVKLIDGTGNFLPESKRGTPTPFVAFTKITGLYKVAPKLFGKYYAQHLSENETGKVEILVGAFMVMKRSLYLDVGGFDENCFMYSDDIDLSYVVLQRGFSNYYFADTVVIHYKGESTVKDHLYMKRFRDAMNYFYQKHFKISALFDVFMKSGAFVFSLYKGKSAATKRRIVNRNIIVTNSTELASRVENLLGTNVLKISANDESVVPSLLSDGIETQIIFDNNDLLFSSIIEKMQHWSRNNLTFKIIPPNSAFMVGSNSSNDRGEVVQISEIPAQLLRDNRVNAK